MKNCFQTIVPYGIENIQKMPLIISIVIIITILF